MMCPIIKPGLPGMERVENRSYLVQVVHASVAPGNAVHRKDKVAGGFSNGADEARRGEVCPSEVDRSHRRRECHSADGDPP